MSFESEKPFNDFQHFARGLRRSGDFTINESNLLEKYGTAMMELYNGTREPSNDEEKEFWSNYGLFKEDELVGVATFANSRYKAEKYKADWEWMRLCYKDNIVVRGGTSKFIKTFTKN